MTRHVGSAISVVVLTYNRRREVLRTVGRLQTAAPGVPLVVVDNAGTDGTGDALRRRFPRVRVVRAPVNLGAAGRNLGIEAAGTRYVAFCDDDVCWLPGALARAADVLDRHLDVAVLSARVLVGPAAAPDPACAPMAASPLAGEPDVGPALIGFMAGACVIRATAFRQAGGYWPPLFIGGEEALLALDLMERGWRILYAPALAAQHWPSTRRDTPQRRRLLARNALLLAWMRLPWNAALVDALGTLAALPGWAPRWAALRDALRHGLAAGARRHVMGTDVRCMLAAVRRSKRRRSVAGLTGDRQHDARDVAGAAGRRQEDVGRRELLGLGGTSVLGLLAEIRHFVGRLVGRVQGRPDRPRRHGVDADAALDQIGRQRARKRMDGPLGG